MLGLMEARARLVSQFGFYHPFDKSAHPAIVAHSTRLLPVNPLGNGVKQRRLDQRLAQSATLRVQLVLDCC
jgi:hypothetical protein